MINRQDIEKTDKLWFEASVLEEDIKNIKQGIVELANMQDFDAIIQQFRNKDLSINHWNFAIQQESDKYSAYIMGEGAEQCLACKKGFDTKEEIVTSLPFKLND